MDTILKIWAYDRPGVLDRIAGLIRRQGWNVSSMTAGDVEEGLSQIHLSLSGKNVDAEKLGEHLDELDGVRRWEECLPQTHVIREMAMFSVRKDRPVLPEMDGLRIVDKQCGLLFAEYTGSPHEVSELLRQVHGQTVSCVRTGPLVLSAQENPPEEEPQ